MLNSKVSEQNARMKAMNSSTQNANDIIKDLATKMCFPILILISLYILGNELELNFISTTGPITCTTLPILLAMEVCYPWLGERRSIVWVHWYTPAGF